MTSEGHRPARKRAAWRRILDATLGYDFFISYSWKDGRKYATELASALEQRGYEVFLDSDDYASGDNWQEIGAWTLRRTGQLILVATPVALTGSNQESPVEREVRIFASTGRRIIPINFVPTNREGETEFERSTLHEARKTSKVLQYIAPEMLAVNEDASRRETGPSEPVLQSLQRTFTLVRQDKKRVALFAVISLFLTALAIAAVTLGFLAESSRREVARQLADTWFSLSESIADEDPLAAFALVARAAQVVPDDDPAETLYLNRAIHLLDVLPENVLNLPVQESVQDAVFDDSLEVVALVTEGGRLRVFDLKEGKPLHVPDKVNQNGLRGTPSFDKHGNISAYVQWFHPEPDPDQRCYWALHILWNPRNGKILTPVDDGSVPWEKLDLDVNCPDSPEEWALEDEGVEATSPETEPAPRAAEQAAAARLQLEQRLSPFKARALNRTQMVTTDSAGSILFWPVQSQSPLLHRVPLGTGGWTSSVFVGENLLALDRDHILVAWHLPTRKRLWSQRLPAGERLILSPDQTMVYVEGAVSWSWDASEEDRSEPLFRVSDGKRIPMPGSISESGYQRLGTALTPSGAVAHAFRFVWEAGDDLIFEWNFREGADQKSGCYEQPQAKPEQFLSFLQDGQYVLLGSPTSFTLLNLCRKEPAAQFYFGQTGSLTANDAKELLSKVTTVRRSAASPQLQLGLRGRTQLITAPTDDVFRDLRLASDGAPLRSSRKPQCVTGSNLAVSPDGRWLASTANQRLCVWDSRTGYTLTNATELEGTAQDIAFSPDSRTIHLSSSVGSVTRLVVALPWSNKPAWLDGLGEALTGRLVADDGSTSRLTLDKVRESRAQLAHRLVGEDSESVVIRLLRQRLESRRPVRASGSTP